jgi:hypothetical protein
MTAARRVLIRAGRAIDVGLGLGSWDYPLTHLLKWSVHAAGRAFFCGGLVGSGVWGVAVMEICHLVSAMQDNDIVTRNELWRCLVPFCISKKF